MNHSISFKRISMTIIICAGMLHSVTLAQTAVGAVFKGGIADMAAAYDKGGDSAAARSAQAHGLKARKHAGQSLYPVIVDLAPGVTGASFDTSWLTQRGIIVDAVSATHARVLVPFKLLRTLAGHPQIQAMLSPAVPMAQAYGLGTKISEAVVKTEAASLQQSMPAITGSGVKVAIIDIGYIGLANAIAKGELPAATVKVNLPGINDDTLESVTSHGVAVAEQVMDMAPGATLYCIMVGDQVDLQNAAAYLKTNSIHIANHSVGWFNDGGYYNDSGVIAGIVNTSHDSNNVFWSVAAGNEAQMHWRGTWSDPNNDSILNFTADSQSISLTATSATSSNVFLNWNQYKNPVTDLNLYIYDKNGLLVSSSTNVQATTKDPSEVAAFTWSAALSPYTVVVRRKSGPVANLDMTIFCPSNTMTHAVARSSISSPADAHGAFSVGAVQQSVWNTAAPAIEVYSSRGPTTDNRMKPDIAAPDRTTTLTYGDSASSGTSFAAPVAAGAAALLMQRYPAITALALADTLRALARDVGPVGKDSAYGAGLLYVWLPPPVLTLPAAGATGVISTPTLSWSSAVWASTYRVQVATASTFAVRAVDDSTLATASKTVATLALKTTWFWRAQARKTIGSSAWSAIRSFTTIDTVKRAYSQGWHLMSLNVHPVDSSAAAVFGSMKTFVIAKDIKGNNYWPAYAIATLSTVHVVQGYMSYTTAADTLRVAVASTVNPAITPVPLTAGWNMLSYLPSAAMSPVTALADVSARMLMVKNNDGNVYWPAFGINGMAAMQPGEGYYIYMSAADTLTYPGTGKYRAETAALPLPQHFGMLLPTGSSATMLLRSVTVNGANAPDNSEIGVFNLSGALVGSGTVLHGSAACTVWGNDPFSPAKNGCAPGEKLSCRLWTNNAEYPLAFIGTSAPEYSDNGIIMGSLSARTAAGVAAFAFSGAYPNPFTKNIRLSFDVPASGGLSMRDVDISVYTLNGVLVSRLADGAYAAGHHTVTWDAGAPGSNVYVAVMKSGSFCAKLRLFKVR